MAGLVALQFVYVAVGAALLWAAGGWTYVTELCRLVGVAYFLGRGVRHLGGYIHAVVLGLPFTAATLAGVAALTVGAALGVGLARRRVVRGLAPGWSVRWSWIWGVGLAACCAYFVTMLLATRVHPIGEWDAWWVWTIRAKSLFFFGDLGGAELVGGGDYQGYPPALVRCTDLPSSRWVSLTE